MASTSARSSISCAVSACDGARELAGERARGRARRRLGRCIDQVGHRLGLRQVESIVEERTPRELPRLGKPQAHRAPRLEAARDQQAQHDRTAMPLQFEHVLAGVRMRRRESKAQCRRRAARPSTVRNVQCVAWRGTRAGCDGPSTPSITGARFAPDTRTMPMPPRPGAVAMATMGSESIA